MLYISIKIQKNRCLKIVITKFRWVEKSPGVWIRPVAHGSGVVRYNPQTGLYEHQVWDRGEWQTRRTLTPEEFGQTRAEHEARETGISTKIQTERLAETVGEKEARERITTAVMGIPYKIAKQPPRITEISATRIKPGKRIYPIAAAGTGGALYGALPITRILHKERGLIYGEEPTKEREIRLAKERMRTFGVPSYTPTVMRKDVPITGFAERTPVVRKIYPTYKKGKKVYEKAEEKARPIAQKILPDIGGEAYLYATQLEKGEKAKELFRRTPQFYLPPPFQLLPPIKPIKDFERETLARVTYFGAGAYEGIRQKPIKAIAIGTAFFLLPYAGKAVKIGAKGVSHLTGLKATGKAIRAMKLSKMVGGSVLGGTYAGTEIYEFKKAPTVGEAYTGLGATFGTEILPGMVGGLAGKKTISLLKKRYGKTRIPYEITEYPPPKEIVTRARSARAIRDISKINKVSEAQIREFGVTKPKPIVGEPVTIQTIKPGKIRGIGRVKRGVIVTTGKEARGFVEYPDIDIRTQIVSDPKYTRLTYRKISTGKLIGEPKKFLTLETGYKDTESIAKMTGIKDLVSIPGERMTYRTAKVTIPFRKKVITKGIIKEEKLDMFRVLRQIQKTTAEKQLKITKVGKYVFDEKGMRFLSEETLKQSLKAPKIKYGLEKFPPGKVRVFEGDKIKIERVIPGKIVSKVETKIAGFGRGIITERREPFKLPPIRLKLPMIKGKRGAMALTMARPQLLPPSQVVSVPVPKTKLPTSRIKTISSEILMMLPKEKIKPTLFLLPKLRLKPKLDLKAELLPKIKPEISPKLMTEPKIKTIIKTKPRIKTKLETKLQLKQLLRTELKPQLMIQPEIGITPPLTPGIIRTPPPPPPPTEFIMPLFFGGKKMKKPSKKSLKSQIKALLPDFTTRALGLEAVKGDINKAIRDMKKEATGLEVRRGFLIEKKPKKKRKKRI